MEAFGRTPESASVLDVRQYGQDAIDSRFAELNEQYRRVLASDWDPNFQGAVDQFTQEARDRQQEIHAGFERLEQVMRAGRDGGRIETFTPTQENSEILIIGRYHDGFAGEGSGIYVDDGDRSLGFHFSFSRELPDQIFSWEEDHEQSRRGARAAQAPAASLGFTRDAEGNIANTFKRFQPWSRKTVADGLSKVHAFVQLRPQDRKFYIGVRFQPRIAAHHLIYRCFECTPK